MVNLNILNNYKHSLLLKDNEYRQDFFHYKDFNSFKKEYLTNIYFHEGMQVNSLCFDSFDEAIIDTLNIKEHRSNYQHIFVIKNTSNDVISKIINNLNSKGIDKSDIVIIDSFNKVPFKAIEFEKEEHSLCFNLLRGAAFDALGKHETLDDNKVAIVENIKKGEELSKDIYNYSQFFVNTCKALSKVLNTDTYYERDKHYIFNFDSIEERSILAGIFKYISFYDRDCYSNKRFRKCCRLYLDCPDFLNEYALVFPCEISPLYSYHLFIGNKEKPDEINPYFDTSFSGVATCSLFYSKKDNEFCKKLEKTGLFLKTNTSKKERLSQIKNLVFLKKTNY